MNEIFTFGGADTLIMLLNSIAAMTSTDDYTSLIKVALLITTFLVALDMAASGKIGGTSRVFILVIIFNAAIITKIDIVVTDRVYPAESGTVDNVPVGIAIPTAIFSRIGDWTTRTFETFYSLPNQTRFSGNGYAFTSRLVQSTMDQSYADTRTAANIAEFTQNCIYYGTLVGWYSWNTLLTTDDLWGYIGTTGQSQIIFTNFIESDETTNLVTCKDSYDKINADLPNTITSQLEHESTKLFPKELPAQAQARMLAALPQSIQFLTNITKTAPDLIKQKLMIRSMEKGLVGYAAKADSSDAIKEYSVAMAERQQKTTYDTLGSMSSRTLSMLRNVFEAIIIGIFPLVMFFILIAKDQGKAITSYLKWIIWIQLWPVFYAIINYVIAIHSQEASLAAVTIPASLSGGTAMQAFSMLTADGLKTVHEDYAAQAGYLTWLVPTLSWAFVSGGQYAGAQLASGVGGIAQSAGGAAAGEASRGNINMGNMSMDNLSMSNSSHSNFNGGDSSFMQQNTAPNVTRGSATLNEVHADGITTTTSGDGTQTFSSLKSNMGISQNLSSGLTATATQGLENSQTAAKENINNYTSTSQTAQNESADYHKSYGESNEAGIRTSLGSNAEYQRAHEQVKTTMDSLSKSTGLTESALASLGVSGNAGVGPNMQVVRANIDGNLAGRTDAERSEIFNKIKDATDNESFRTATSTVDTAQRDDHAARTASGTNSAGRGFSTNRDEIKALGNTVQKSMNEVTAAKSTLDEAKRIQSDGGMDLQDQFIGHVANQNFSGDRANAAAFIHDAVRDGGSDMGKLNDLQQDFAQKTISGMNQLSLKEINADNLNAVNNADQRNSLGPDANKKALDADHNNGVEIVNSKLEQATQIENIDQGMSNVAKKVDDNQQRQTTQQVGYMNDVNQGEVDVNNSYDQTSSNVKYSLSQSEQPGFLTTSVIDRGTENLTENLTNIVSKIGNKDEAISSGLSTAMPGLFMFSNMRNIYNSFTDDDK